MNYSIADRLSSFWIVGFTLYISISFVLFLWIQHVSIEKENIPNNINEVYYELSDLHIKNGEIKNYGKKDYNTIISDTSFVFQLNTEENFNLVYIESHNHGLWLGKTEYILKTNNKEVFKSNYINNTEIQDLRGPDLLKSLGLTSYYYNHPINKMKNAVADASEYLIYWFASIIIYLVVSAFIFFHSLDIPFNFKRIKLSSFFFSIFLILGIFFNILVNLPLIVNIGLFLLLMSLSILSTIKFILKYDI